MMVRRSSRTATLARMVGSGGGAESEMNAARELFFQYDGSLFYMSRDGADRVYASYGVPPSTESEWLAELTARKLAALGSDGNWWVLNFLVDHGIDGHLDEALAVKPLGKLWERTAFLEFLLRYVDVCRETADRQTIDTAIDFVVAEGNKLLRACRSNRTRARVEKAIASAESRR